MITQHITFETINDQHHLNSTGVGLFEKPGEATESVYGQGNKKLPFAFDLRLNQIAVEWHQVKCSMEKSKCITAS